MKRTHYLYIIAATLGLMSFMASDEAMTKENGVYVINTTDIGKDIEGYQAPTPLKVYIKNNKVEKIEFLKTLETPKYYVKVNSWGTTLSLHVSSGETTRRYPRALKRQTHRRRQRVAYSQ